MNTEHPRQCFGDNSEEREPKHNRHYRPLRRWFSMLASNWPISASADLSLQILITSKIQTSTEWWVVAQLMPS